VVGLTFHVPKEHLVVAEAMAAALSPDIVRLQRVGSSPNHGIYKDYPESSWLEIRWTAMVPNQIIDIQTSDVLWYPRLRSADTCPVALGIENLDNLVAEADYDLVVPTSFPFGPLTFEFMND
jgi:hypothetical protein